MAKKKNQSLLWSYTDPLSGTTSYLFGTMHIKDYRAFIWQDELTNYIDACNSFAAEFNLDDSNILTQESVSKIPNNQTLPDLVGAKKYKRLHKMCNRAFKIDLDTVETLLPLFTINLITERVLIKSNGVPLDTYLWQYAKQQLKNMCGVETVYEQIETLNKLSLDYQLKTLLSIGRNPGKFKKQIEGLLKMYVNNDLKGLYKKSRKSLGKKRNILLYGRNIIMADRIEKLIKGDSCFIAIGAAHLPGKKGVLNLLKNRGSTFRPIYIA